MTEGMKIRWKRKMMGMSAQDLADRCCVTKQTICNIETEKASSAATVKLIKYELAKAFGEWDPESILPNLNEED